MLLQQRRSRVNVLVVCRCWWRHCDAVSENALGALILLSSSSSYVKIDAQEPFRAIRLLMREGRKRFLSNMRNFLAIPQYSHETQPGAGYP